MTMKTRIVIENGEVKHDVLGGQGTACQQGSDPYLKALQRQFGLPGTAFVEDCKPEMNQVSKEADKLEGDKLA